MNALEEYQEFTDVAHTHYLPPVTLRELADAAVAELLVTIDRTRTERNDWHLQADAAWSISKTWREERDKARAELAALKARRCETCRFDSTCDSTVPWWLDSRNEREQVLLPIESCSRWEPQEDQP